MEKNYDLAIDPDTQRSEEIRQLTTGQAEDYATGCYQIMIISKIVID